MIIPTNLRLRGHEEYPYGRTCAARPIWLETGALAAVSKQDPWRKMGADRAKAVLFRVVVIGVLSVVAITLTSVVNLEAGYLVLLICILVVIAGAVVVSFLKGRLIAGGVGIFAIWLLYGEVGLAGFILGPLGLVLSIVPVVSAFFPPKAGSFWLSRSPTDPPPDDQGIAPR